jgi:transposase
MVTVCLIRMSRGGQVAGELLGESFCGILVTDRYSAYNWYPVRWRQLPTFRAMKRAVQRGQ